MGEGCCGNGPLSAAADTGSRGWGISDTSDVARATRQWERSVCAKRESRAYAMLQDAVPAMIREELVANRDIHCVALLFHVMRVYQPGGLQERTMFLEALSNPGSSNTASEAVTKLRAWGRALARATAMQINVPDASLDHCPTLQTVREYTKIIQSEFDMLAISGSALEPGPKKPKLAAMQQEGGKGKLRRGQGKDGKSGREIRVAGICPGMVTSLRPQAGRRRQGLL